MDRVNEPSCAKSLEGREGVSTASTLMATLYLHQALEIWTCEEKVRWQEERPLKKIRRCVSVIVAWIQGAGEDRIWLNYSPFLFLVFSANL